MGCGCGNKFITTRRGNLRGFGADSGIETIGCPPGTKEATDNKGGIWCEDPQGNKSAATLTPVDGGAVPAPASSGGLGVIGWSLIGAAALVGGAFMLKGPKARYASNRKRVATKSPGAEWDRLWARYMAAKRSGSASAQARAAAALRGFDKRHGFAPMATYR